MSAAATPPAESEFRAMFPSFGPVKSPTVRRYLRLAALELDECVWGDLWEAGVLYRAADLMAREAFAAGADTEQDGAGATNKYGVTFNELLMQVAPGVGRCP